MNSKSNTVAVIGLGAAGTFAACAASALGFAVDVYTADTSTRVSPGAVWLHWIPPTKAVTGSATPIYVTGQGDAKSYSKLQWGTSYPSSFPEKPVWEYGYDPAVVLETLLPDKCEVITLAYRLSDADIRDLASTYVAVFQTFPTQDSFLEQPALVPFVSAARWGSEDTAKNWVMYNGTGKGIIVREASLWGNRFLEFPKNMTLAQVKQQTDLSGFHSVVLKDIHPNTKPWTKTTASNVHLIGRWATWDRKYLSHDAYDHVQRILKAVTS